MKSILSSNSAYTIISTTTLLVMSLLSVIDAHAVENKDSTQLDKFEVTGSHIKRLDFEGPAPVTIIDQEEIKQSGASTVNELLSKLTVNTGFMLNENQPASTTPGSSSINMRGLGQDATLVLLNGRRTTNYPFSLNNSETFVDLNAIPLAAVERIEILKDGGSAIYGSDALAGVVNIILKNDYDGAEISVSYGVSGEGDADETHVNFIKGKSSDKDNITFVLDYFKREPFLLSDRSFSRTAFQPDINPTYGRDYTQPDFHPANYSNFDFSIDVFNGFFDVNPWVSAVPESERVGGLFSYKRDISTDLAFFTDFMINQSNTIYQLAPSAFWTDFDVDQFGDPVLLPAAHPANPTGTDDLYLLWRMTELGPRVNDVTTDTLRLVAGFEGVYQDWDWEAAVLHAKSKSTLDGKNYASITAIQDAFNNDQLNPFGNSSTSDLNTIRRSITRTAETTTQGIDVKFSGEVGMLEHGPIVMATGLAYLDEKFQDSPDALAASYDIVGEGFTEGEGDRSSTAVFAELNLPLQENLEMQVALRAEDYSDFGSTVNPKLAVKYRPRKDLMLRASAGTAFRAPSLSELHQSDSVVFGFYVDTAYCEAAGGIDPTACDPVPLPVVVSSNPDLDAEESTSYYLGALFEPTRNFSIGVDYWHYDQDNVVSFDPQSVLDENDPVKVERVSPDPTDFIIQVNDQYTNTANRRTDGIDLELKYQWDTEVGRFEFKNTTTKVLSFKEKVRSQDPFEDKAGTYQFPDLRSRFSLLWDKQDYAAALHANYTSSYEDLYFEDDGHKIDSYMTYDGQFTYSGIENMKIIFGINNILDEEPPFSNASFLSYDEATHNPTGRFYYIRLNHQFN